MIVESIKQGGSLAIFHCYEGKGDVLVRGNSRKGTELNNQIFKIVEGVIEELIRVQVNVNEMQFGFIPARETADAIFAWRHIQEK